MLKRIIFFACCLSLSTIAGAQAITTATTTICLNTTYDFYAPYYSDATYTWDTPIGGQIMFQDHERASIRWTSAPSGTVTCRVRSVSVDFYAHSSNITLKISNAGNLPNKQACYGQPLNLQLTGEQNINFITWQKQVGVDWIDVAPSEVLTVTASNRYRAKVSDQCGANIMYSGDGLVTAITPTPGTITNSIPLGCFPPNGTLDLHWTNGGNSNLSAAPTKWEWQYGTGNPNGTWNSSAYDGQVDALFSMDQAVMTVRTKTLDTFCGSYEYAYYTAQLSSSPSVGTINYVSAVCENVAQAGTLSVSGSNGNINWYRFDASHASYISLGGGTSIAAPNLTNTTTFKVVASQSPCSPVEQYFTINVSPLTVTGHLSTAVPEFCNSPEYIIYLNNKIGDVVRWETRSRNNSTQFSQWSPIANTSTSLSVQAGLPGAMTLHEYRAVVKSGVCAALETNPLLVIVNSEPEVSSSVSTQTIFSGSSTNITLTSDVLNPQFVWTQEPSNSTGGANQQTPVATTLQQTITLVNEEFNGSVSYAVRAVNSTGCQSDPIEIQVVIIPRPVIISSNGSRYQDYLVMGVTLDLNTDLLYNTYAWTKDANVGPIATTPSVSIESPGTVTVTVTKSGITGTGSSLPFYVQTQMDGVNKNYIISNSILVRGVTNSEGIADLSNNELAQSITYFDGLGRRTQVVSTQASPKSRDIVQHFGFDKFNREEIMYLPISAGATGHYKSESTMLTPTTGQLYQFYNGSNTSIATDQKPFSRIQYESSPLNRVLKIGAPGAAWQPEDGKPISKQYLTNENTEHLTKYSVLNFNYDYSSSSITLTPGTAAYYQQNELSVTETRDEDGHYTIEFADKQGRTVCKKVEAPPGASSTYTYRNASGTTVDKALGEACTYYIYDINGNLAVVISPEGLKAFLTAVNFQP